MKSLDEHRRYMREWMRKWREKNKEKARKQSRQWYKNSIIKHGREKFMGMIAASVKRTEQKDPRRRLAYNKVYVEMRAGRLKKSPCFCGAIKVHAHHDDYDYPLRVIWLCPPHHRDADKERRLKEKKLSRGY